jgi:hypothetical protein
MTCVLPGSRRVDASVRPWPAPGSVTAIEAVGVQIREQGAAGGVAGEFATLDLLRLHGHRRAVGGQPGDAVLVVSHAVGEHLARGVDPGCGGSRLRKGDADDRGDQHRGQHLP